MDEKYKVAIIAGQLVVGGAERQLYLWLKHMDRNKFDPLVITLHPGHHDFWEEPIEALGIPLKRIPQAANPIKRMMAICQRLRVFKPDLIHGWHLFSGAYAGLAGLLFSLPAIGGLRSSLNGHEHSIEAILVRRFCKGLIANSENAAQSWQALAPKSQKVFTVPNAIPYDFLPKNEARSYLADIFCIDPDRFWIGSIGRLDPLKRFDLLLPVLAKLKAETPPVHLVMIGKGSELVRLKEQAAILKIEDHVTFTGEIPDANKLLPAFDLFCFPSLSEGLPNVILEAAAAALPIAAWDLPFNREILDAESAMLLPPEDLDALAKAVSELIGDPNRRKALGERAQERVLSRFSIERFVKGMTQAYLTILGEDFNGPAT